MYARTWTLISCEPLGIAEMEPLSCLTVHFSGCGGARGTSSLSRGGGGELSSLLTVDCATERFSKNIFVHLQHSVTLRLKVLFCGQAAGHCSRVWQMNNAGIYF